MVTKRTNVPLTSLFITRGGREPERQEAGNDVPPHATNNEIVSYRYAYVLKPAHIDVLTHASS